MEKKCLTSFKIKEQIKKSRTLIQKENFQYALEVLEKINRESNDTEVQNLIRFCHKKLARKYWRQEKLAEFKTTIHALGNNESLKLAYSRLSGTKALEELASADSGIESTLAACALQPDVKAGLQLMRKNPTLKTLAEGWLYLLKGDLELAKKTFQESSIQHPTQAKVGIGLVHLAENRKKMAENDLAQLRPFAQRRFPRLKEAMTWGEEKCAYNLELPLSYYLFEATLPELLKEQKQCPTKNGPLQGYLWLTIGDRLSQTSYQKATTAWDKALTYYPQLKEDVLKRYYALNESSEKNKHFLRLYRHYLKVNSAEARLLVEHLVFNSSTPPEFFLSSKELSVDGKNWIFPTPPIEIKLLWFHLRYQESLFNFSQVVGFCKNYSSLASLTKEEWNSLIMEILTYFPNNETLLVKACTLFELIERPRELMRAAAHLLKICPHLKTQIVPQYTRNALRYYYSISKIEIQKDCIIEVQELLNLYPSDFDLIRLSILWNQRTAPIEEQLLPFSSVLSQPLFATLRLQAYIDYGKKVTYCRKLMPPLEVLQQSQEASWRFLMALSTPLFDFPKKECITLYSMLVPNDEYKHELFSKMQNYGGILPFHSILLNWSKKSVQNWQPDYHLGVYYAHHDRNELLIKHFRKASLKAKSENPEFILIRKTLDYHHFSMDDDEEGFSDDDFPDFEDIDEEFFKRLEEIFGK